MALYEGLEAQRVAMFEQSNVESLTITVVAAEDLLAADKNGKSDPYAVVELLDKVSLVRFERLRSSNKVSKGILTQCGTTKRWND